MNYIEEKKPLKILDCTLRDGGYYNNWDFDIELIKEIYKDINIPLIIHGGAGKINDIEKTSYT